VRQLWRRWRAAHYRWDAYITWYYDPTPANAAAWARANENLERLRLPR
jgi:hypothetical protein